MPRTTSKSKVSKARTPEQVKAEARAYADRTHRKAGDREPVSWTTLYIRAWRRLSGLPRTTPGPVPVMLPARRPRQVA